MTTLVTAAFPRPARSQSSSATFSRDVAPILFEKCVGCHRPGEIGPMPLVTYQDVRPWAKSIRTKVVSREMPPWHADPRYGKFRNDRSLTQQQIDTIVAWIDSGAAKGDDADLPSAPVFTSGWQTGEPDYIVEMPLEYDIPPQGQLNAVNFWVPVPFKQDRFVETMELRPGNSRVVHHIGVSIATLPQGATLTQQGEMILPDGTLQNANAQAKTSERGIGATRPSARNEVSNLQGGDGGGRPTNSLLVAYVPGGGVYRRPPGIGRRIPAGTYFVFNMHYQPTGQVETDRSRLGLWFSKETNVQEIYEHGVGEPLLTSRGQPSFYRIDTGEKRVETYGPQERGFPLIPPGAQRYEIVGITPVTDSITLHGMWPHAHLRATDMTWTLTWPDGRKQVLLSVPKYTFEWQILYTLEQPLKIPAGSTITAVAHYDNSSRNRMNPDPDREVHWSESSWEEMFIPFIQYTIDSEARLKKPTNRQQP
jgi:hypothetical protein